MLFWDFLASTYGPEPYAQGCSKTIDNLESNKLQDHMSWTINNLEEYLKLNILQAVFEMYTAPGSYSNMVLEYWAFK